MNDAPIGIFDSGVGGLTVARAFLDQRPQEQIIYVGDTAHTSYGTRPLAEVRRLALAVMDDLVSRGVKMLVIACNSASTAVLRDARERYTAGRGLPVVEVIAPAARRAVATTRNKRIGVIGTELTIMTGAYQDMLAVVPGVQITAQACPKFVELVESGITTGPEVLAAVHEYLDPVKDEGVDTLILGCTHYPLLTGVISYVMGDDVALVSSGQEAANEICRVLAANDLVRENGAEPTHRFIVTGDPEPFHEKARRFLGPEVRTVETAETT